MNENELENLCLEWFRESGWQTIYGPDYAPETPDALRKDYREVI
jgi:type I restriction enzyme R subunit